jgi:Fe-S-cluster containining protein
MTARGTFRGELKKRRTRLKQSTRFAFSCRSCRRCCRDKRIQVNPYEIARIARNLGISTTDFILKYTTRGGTLLKSNGDGTCLFLCSHGCSVHRDRPLVCRLYPLGRHVLMSGEEHFSEIEPEPGCRGIYVRRNEKRTIRDYLMHEAAYSFMKAADRYLYLFWKLLVGIQRENATKPEEAIFSNLFQTDTNCEWMDMDATVSKYCKEMRLPFPVDTKKKMSYHVKAIKAWLQI